MNTYRSNKNILVTTFGGTWLILPELIGYTNPESFDFYKNHSHRTELFKKAQEKGIEAIDELWVIHTDSEIAKEALYKFERWQKYTNTHTPIVKYFSYQTVSEMGTEQECNAMSDLIMRVMLHAKAQVGSGKLFVSLVGGRKNMSAEIQRAADLFGCHTLLHIADNIKRGSLLSRATAEDLKESPEQQEADQINPMIVYGQKNANPILYVEHEILAEDFPLQEGINKKTTTLLNEINRRHEKANSLLINSYQQRISASKQSSFYGLHMVHPEIIKQLENTFIGRNLQKVETELAWLRRLPKAELHCHIGGILSPSDMVKVALELSDEVAGKAKTSPSFAEKIMYFREAVENNQKEVLINLVSNAKKGLRIIQGVPEPLGVAAFLIAFKGKEKLLEELLYSEFPDNESFIGIGIEKYEKLGDLQGSGILKHRKTLAKTCEILKQKCAEDNVLYCELRCSPANYTTPDFSIDDVFNTIYQSLSGAESTVFSVIIIGSRHNRKDLLGEHIKLARRLNSQSRYKKFFVGFDIAGDEKKKSPAELKNDLSDLLHECIKTTIHAGEGVSASNIWEAAYELNADRIGHGLTLENDPRLLQRLIDRRIAIEMCPSSNYQIIGYKNFTSQNPVSNKIYPLKKYFDQGVRITINTDNPGISRTTLSKEYLLAAQLTKGGISQWDILKIIRNGFKNAFISGDRKKQLLLDAENKISSIINDK